MDRVTLTAMFFRYDLKEAEALAKKLVSSSSKKTVPEEKISDDSVSKGETTESKPTGEARFLPVIYFILYCQLRNFCA